MGNQKKFKSVLNLIWISVEGFKGIVSQDFELFQIILMNRIWVPDVPLEVKFFSSFSYSF